MMGHSALLGAILMFGFLKSTTASQLNPYSTADAEFNRAKTEWDSADVAKRTSLLKRAIEVGLGHRCSAVR
jgi:hypothetical protein